MQDWKQAISFSNHFVEESSQLQRQIQALHTEIEGLTDGALSTICLTPRKIICLTPQILIYLTLRIYQYASHHEYQGGRGYAYSI